MEKTIVPPNIAAFDSNLIKFPCVFLLRFSFDLGGVRDGVEIFKIACYLCCQATATLNHRKIMLILSFLYRMIYSNVRTLIKIRTRLIKSYKYLH